MLDPKTLNNFCGKANHAHQQFCVWFYMNNEFAKHQAKWNQEMTEFSGGTGCKYKNFWDVSVASLQHSWILSSARLFDPAYALWDKQKLKPRLSLYYVLGLLDDRDFAQLIENRIIKYQPTIQSLKYIRHNFGAHNAVDFHPARIEAGIEDLFEKLDAIIIDLKQHQSNLQNCNNINLKYTDALSKCGVDEIFEALSKHENMVTKQ